MQRKGCLSVKRRWRYSKNNLRRHYESRHKDKYDNLQGQMCADKLSKLKSGVLVIWLLFIFINSVIYFLTFFSVKIPERVINIWLCVAFWKTINVYIEAPLRSSHLFCYKVTPAPIREGKSYVALTGKSLGTPDLVTPWDRCPTTKRFTWLIVSCCFQG